MESLPVVPGGDLAEIPPAVWKADSFIKCPDGNLDTNLAEISSIFPLCAEVAKRWKIDPQVVCEFPMADVAFALDAALGKKILDSPKYYSIYYFFQSEMKNSQKYLEKITSVENIFSMLSKFSVGSMRKLKMDCYPYEDELLRECERILLLRANQCADYKNTAYMHNLCKYSYHIGDIFGINPSNPNLILVLQAFIYQHSTGERCTYNATTNHHEYIIRRLMSEINIFMIRRKHMIAWQWKEEYIREMGEFFIYAIYKYNIWKDLPHSYSIDTTGNGEKRLTLNIGDNVFQTSDEEIIHEIKELIDSK